MLFLSSSSPLKLHQSSNLCTPFLLQIAKGSHFRSREAHLSIVGLHISGIDGDPVLRGTRIRATWEYVSSVEGGQLGMVDLCVICRCGKSTCTIAQSPPSTTYDGVVPGDMSRGSGDLGDVRGAPDSQPIKEQRPQSKEACVVAGQLWILSNMWNIASGNRLPRIAMEAQFIHDRVEMECLEGVWETLEGNARCRFRGTIRLTATSLVHPEEPARTLQHTVEWILPTPTPYLLVEPVQVIEGDEDPLPEVDSSEDVMRQTLRRRAPKQKNSEALPLSHAAFFFSSSSTIVSQQSSNLWPSFLLQIAKGEHFWSREVRGYEWNFEISEFSAFALFCLAVITVLFECCFAWMLWKLGRIDGDPVLRETRIWATWEYVSSVGEWYLEICRGDQETLGTSGGVLLPKTKLDQSRPNPGIVGQLENEVRKLGKPLIVMAAQLIRDRVEMECLEGVWETLEGNTRCRFRGIIRFTATSLVHPDEPARTLQRTVEWILPTPTPYRLVEPVQVIEVMSSEEDPEEDLEELPPEPTMDALDFLEGDEDPLLEVDSPEEVMSASEADSTEDGGPGEMAISGGSSS
ncbi:hypothetical protein HKD37_05G012935 [Glycine soja]